MTNLNLVINAGSTSVKFALFKRKEGSPVELCRGEVEGVGSNVRFMIHDRGVIDQRNWKPPSDICTTIRSVDDAFELIANWLKSCIPSERITSVVYRVVHGGNTYTKPVYITDGVLEQLELLVPLAPLHQSVCLKAIRTFMKKLPNTHHIACFDTAFHRSMPRVAQTFALPQYLHLQGIKPYGFHGLSYQYIAGRLLEHSAGNMPRRTIIAHLGGGASICALLNGKSISTSMTFSPLDGLAMATRSGAIDASAVIYLIEQLNYSPSEVTNILNKESGLLGLSGLSGDIRVLLNSDCDNAKFALEFYVDRISREIGAMITSLKGIDTLVFTGGVGSNSAEIRKRVCANFDWLGMSLDSAANEKNSKILSNTDSLVEVCSIKTDEEMLMATLVNIDFDSLHSDGLKHEKIANEQENEVLAIELN